jgi:DNA-binding winged helix-turn-helix (wHTH) protein/tetratricopeptide (TPR) repeat protein
LSEVKERILRFGVFEADLRTRELRRQGVRVAIQDKPFELLAALLEQPGEMVSREDLQARLWPDVTVDAEIGLNKAVKKLRDALRDSAESPRFIETVKGRGYRFLAEVRRGGEADASAPPAPIAAFQGQSLVVLPFEVRGQSEGADYLGQSFAEAIASTLARSESLHVLPVPKAKLLPEDPLALAEWASRLGAQRILMGSLVRNGRSVDVNLSIVDPVHKRVLWGTDRQDPEGFVSHLATELCAEIAAQLGVTLARTYDLPTKMAAASLDLRSIECAEAVKAIERRDWTTAVRAGQNVVRAFPEEFHAHSLHGAALGDQLYSIPTPRNRDALMQEVEWMRARDPANPYGDLLQARSLLVTDPATAAGLYSRVTGRPDVSPELRAWAYRGRASALARLRRDAEALQDAERAVRLDPVGSDTLTELAFVCRNLQDTQGQLEAARKAVAISPYSWVAVQMLGFALYDLGRVEEAARELSRACELGRNQEVCAAAAAVLLRLHAPDAASTAARATCLPESVYGAYNLACFHAATGDTEQALRFLRRCVELGYADGWIEQDPDLEPLRPLPEFQAILSEVKVRLRGA